MIKKILIVDDDVDFLTLIKKRIESWGYIVITASDSGLVADIIETEHPHALILDYMMPGANGIELLRQIRKTNRRIPAIMFTAQPTMKAIESAKDLNVTAFIPKISSLVDTENNLKVTLELIFQNP